ncbi:MAG: N-glycosylase/DNA lyase [Candidatus Kapaibacteriota bacterium]
MRIEKNLKMSDFSQIHQIYKQFKSEIQKALENFHNVSLAEYFYELCYCLLTPASKAHNALVVVEYLKEHNFFETGFDPTDVLRGKVFENGRLKVYIRFHNQKAQRLLQARSDWQKILALLQQPIDTAEKREHLVKIVNGFGYKEASHFLRNVGYTGIAILDRHILGNLQQFGLFSSLPNVASRKNYLAVEKLFFDFSCSVGIPAEELDLLLWAKETGYVLK